MNKKIILAILVVLVIIPLQSFGQVQPFFTQIQKIENPQPCQEVTIQGDMAQVPFVLKVFHDPTSSSEVNQTHQGKSYPVWQKSEQAMIFYTNDTDQYQVHFKAHYNNSTERVVYLQYYSKNNMVYDEQVKYNSQDFCRNFIIYTTVPQHIPTKEELFQPILDAIAAIPAMKDAFDRNTITMSSQISFVYLLVVMIVGLVVGVILLVAAINRRQKSKLQNLDDTAQLMMEAVDKAEKTILDMAENNDRKFSTFENLYSRKMDYVVDHIAELEKFIKSMGAAKIESGDVDTMVRESESNLQQEYESQGEGVILKIFEDTKGKSDLASRATNIAARNILKLIKKTKKVNEEEKPIIIPMVEKTAPKVQETIVENAEPAKVEIKDEDEPAKLPKGFPRSEVVEQIPEQKITIPPPQEEFPREYSELLIGEKPACQFCGQTKYENKTCRCEPNTDHDPENECKNCGECLGESIDKEITIEPTSIGEDGAGAVPEKIEAVTPNIVEIPKPVETNTEPEVIRPPMRSIEEYKKMNSIGTLSDEANWLGNYINHNPDDYEAREKLEIIRKILLGDTV